MVVGPFAGAPDGAFYVEAAADGRPIFIIPWNRQFLIGTTDLRYDGDPAAARATGRDADYLLGEVNRVFPGAVLTRADIHYAYAGVRPLPFRSKGPESAITRRHIITRSTAVAGNLVSIVGGKLTTYRSLAEQSVDHVRIISSPVRSPTWARRGCECPPNGRWRMRPSRVRSKTRPRPRAR